MTSIATSDADPGKLSVKWLPHKAPNPEITIPQNSLNPACLRSKMPDLAGLGRKEKALGNGTFWRFGGWKRH